MIGSNGSAIACAPLLETDAQSHIANPGAQVRLIAPLVSFTPYIRRLSRYEGFVLAFRDHVFAQQVGIPRSDMVGAQPNFAFTIGAVGPLSLHRRE